MKRPLLVLPALGLLAFVLSGSAIESVDAKDDTYRYLANFADTLELAQRNYVEPVDLDQMVQGAFRGLLEELEPESYFLTPELLADYRKPRVAVAETGIDVSKRHGYAIAVTVAPGSPAATRIQPGDYLRVIDGKSTRDMSVFEIRGALRGDTGSEVKLRVVHVADGETEEVTLTRAVVDYPALVTKPLPEGILSLHFARIDQDAVTLARTALRSATELHGVALDLRACSAGNLTAAAKLANLFIDSGVLIKVDGKTGEAAVKTELAELSPVREPTAVSDDPKRYRYRVDARAGDVVWRGPLVVLIDQGTAGPAEATAAALRRNERADVVGVRSFGRSALHDIIPLEDGAAVHLAVARLLDSKDASYLNKGLEPDEAVEPSKDEPDVILKHALEHLKVDGRKKKAA